MRAADVGAKLVLLFALGALLLNLPILAIFQRPATLGGVSVLYLFGVWLAIIVAVLLLARAPWSDP